IAVPDIFLGVSAPASAIDRGYYDSPRAAASGGCSLHGACGRTALSSLYPPPAALASLSLILCPKFPLVLCLQK
ncbi:MAG: hypothetical protein J6Q92_07960, partial [Oscillospiraceae bacterium]|nr:hypothetical protein [Oscillospiraceae bacterium]